MGKGEKRRVQKTEMTRSANTVRRSTNSSSQLVLSTWKRCWQRKEDSSVELGFSKLIWLILRRFRLLIAGVLVRTSSSRLVLSTMDSWLNSLLQYLKDNHNTCFLVFVKKEHKYLNHSYYIYNGIFFFFKKGIEWTALMLHKTRPGWPGK